MNLNINIINEFSKSLITQFKLISNLTFLQNAKCSQRYNGKLSKQIHFGYLLALLRSSEHETHCTVNYTNMNDTNKT